MPRTTIDRLIINSPYEEPQRYWRYDRETRTFDPVEDRRPAGYVVATPRSSSFDDPGICVEIPLVNRIRPRVKAWREAGYSGVTSITKRLLEHWRDPEEFDTRRFFCQLEAVETLIWLTEAPAAERVGIEIPRDGGAFARQCCKIATGTGKTIVMAMTGSGCRWSCRRVDGPGGCGQVEPASASSVIYSIELFSRPTGSV